MTDTLLALVPSYGLYLIFGSVFLSCFALPIPASILVMTAGGFAASGDLTLWQVMAAAFAGFTLGDQSTYQVARKGGPKVLAVFQRRPRGQALLTRAQSLLEKRGPLAVYLSRTIVSPLGPYLGYLSGALGLKWSLYTLAAVLGAATWATAYAGMGYLFADQITQLAALISKFGGVVIAGFALIFSGRWLWRSWKNHQLEQAAQGN